MPLIFNKNNDSGGSSVSANYFSKKKKIVPPITSTHQFVTNYRPYIRQRRGGGIRKTKRRQHFITNTNNKSKLKLTLRNRLFLKSLGFKVY